MRNGVPVGFRRGGVSIARREASTGDGSEKRDR